MIRLERHKKLAPSLRIRLIEFYLMTAWIERHKNEMWANMGYFCLFVWGFSSYSRIFHSYGDFIIAVEGLKILTYVQHSWTLSSKGSLVCHTYFDLWHPFIMVISEDTHTYCRAFVTTCFYDRSVVAGVRTPNLPHARLTL